jgi:hypothetical protein
MLASEREDDEGCEGEDDLGKLHSTHRFEHPSLSLHGWVFKPNKSFEVQIHDKGGFAHPEIL